MAAALFITAAPASALSISISANVAGLPAVDAAAALLAEHPDGRIDAASIGSTGAASAVWSNGAQGLAFIADDATADAMPQLWEIDADGSGLEQLTALRAGSWIPFLSAIVWSEDDQTVSYSLVDLSRRGAPATTLTARSHQAARVATTTPVAPTTPADTTPTSTPESTTPDIAHALDAPPSTLTPNPTPGTNLIAIAERTARPKRTLGPTLAFRSAAKSLTTARKRGLRVKLDIAGASSLKAYAMLSAAAAEHATSGTALAGADGAVTLARTSVARPPSQTTVVTLRFNAAAQETLLRFAKVRLTIRLVATDAQGHRTTVERAVDLR